MSYLTIRRPMNGLTSDFDRLFDSVFGSGNQWLERSISVDVRRTDSEYIIDADLPGMTEEQIDVRVENDLLVITARDEEVAQKEGEEYLIRERRQRSFHRSFALPKDADTASIDARFRNGVLTLTLPKRPEARPRQIEIKRG